jgi:hypothetical protein
LPQQELQAFRLWLLAQAEMDRRVVRIVAAERFAITAVAAEVVEVFYT